MRKRRLILPLLLAGLLTTVVAAACGGGAERDDEGNIVDSGIISILLLQVGDCFQIPESTLVGVVTEAGQIATVPCGTPHDSEVFSLVQVPDQDE